MNTSNEKPLPSTVKFFIGRVIPWSVVLIGALALYVGLCNVLNARESTAWPSVEGKVSKSEVRMQLGSGGGQSIESTVTYHADIEYDYAVNGENLQGTRIAFGDLGTEDRSDADAISDKYPEGTIVTVYYKPKEHQVSLLEPGLRTSTWFPVFLGIPFLLIGLTLVVVLSKIIKSMA